jgi:hypothetical protein
METTVSCCSSCTATLLPIWAEPCHPPNSITGIYPQRNNQGLPTLNAETRSLPRRLEGIGLRVTVGGEDPAPKGGGCGYAKNRAVRQSSGKYLCFCESLRAQCQSTSPWRRSLDRPRFRGLNPKSHTLHPCAVDCDDIMMPDRLSTQLSVFEALPDYEANNLLLGSCYVRLPINSTPRYTDWHNQMSKQQLLTQQYKECTVAMPTWFMKRSRFDAVGPFIERPAEDLMLFQVCKNTPTLLGFQSPFGRGSGALARHWSTP